MLRRTVLAALAVTIGLLALGGRDAAASHTCNPGLAIDSDSDGLPFTCDPNDSQPDIDGDGFEDSLEVFVGTSPLSLCSYPADINGDGRVDIIDVNTLRPPVFLSTADDPFYKARYDLNADEIIDIFDVNVMRPPIAFSSCPFPVHWSTAIARLREGTIHFPKAQVWYSSVANVYVENAVLTSGGATCGEVERAADHWSYLTDFTISAALTGNCNTTSDVRVFFRWTGLDPAVAADTIPYTSGLRACTDEDPCHIAHYADIFLNANFNDPPIANNADFRHVVFTHELGHVVGQGHTGFFPACQPEVPYTIMYQPGFCWAFWDPPLHWVRVNDVLFTNVKY